MFGDLTKCTDNDLMEIFLLILSRPGAMTAFDRTEIHQIDVELTRRRSKLRLVVAEEKQQ